MSEKRKARKTLEETSLIDDLLMNLVASDPNVGEESIRIMLSVLLQRDFSEIRVTSQRIMPGTDTNVRGIRLDVEVEERIEKDGVERVANIYDIEPHRKDYTDLPRRNRYYQAKIDSKRLPIGAKTFTKLPDLYIIMILDHDPFGKDQVVYTFRNHCEEDPSINYQDGLTIMFFNTKGTASVKFYSQSHIVEKGLQNV